MSVGEKNDAANLDRVVLRRADVLKIRNTAERLGAMLFQKDCTVGYTCEGN